MTRIRALVLHAESAANRTLSYQRGWPRNLERHPRFECELVDVRSRGALATLAAARFRRYDAIVLLHSIFSNEPALRGAAFRRVAASPVPKAVFVGNEYKLMPAKIAFLEALGARLVVSQLSSPSAWRLYEERLGCAVIGIPNTGVDTTLFTPATPRSRRPIDLGYRAYDAPLYLGNRERQLLALDVPRALGARSLRLDVSLDPEKRLDEPAWARFLDSCRGQLGSEAGGDFFELTDGTRTRVNAYLAATPDATFDDVYERFFRDYANPVSGRALSGRIVEAAATKTVQILLEGEYGGYFRPNEHYIPLQRDLSGLDEAVDRLLDDDEAARIADAAHDLALSELTYDRLIHRFADALADVVER